MFADLYTVYFTAVSFLAFIYVYIVVPSIQTHRYQSLSATMLEFRLMLWVLESKSPGISLWRLTNAPGLPQSPNCNIPNINAPFFYDELLTELTALLAQPEYKSKGWYVVTYGLLSTPREIWNKFQSIKLTAQAVDPLLTFRVSQALQDMLHAQIRSNERAIGSCPSYYRARRQGP